jgi:hypothetical protein
VRIGIVEPVQYVNDVKGFGLVVHSQRCFLRALRALDDCNAFSGICLVHVLHRSLFSPCPPDDGEADTSSFSTRNQSAGHVVEAHPRVIEEVSDDEWNRAVGEAPLLLTFSTVCRSVYG